MKKMKKKIDGKPERQAIRGAAEHGGWSRGKQWNVKQLQSRVQESVEEHHERSLRDLFPPGQFLT